LFGNRLLVAADVSGLIFSRVAEFFKRVSSLRRADCQSAIQQTVSLRYGFNFASDSNNSQDRRIKIPINTVALAPSGLRR
jgi:hypothetical protein